MAPGLPCHRAALFSSTAGRNQGLLQHPRARGARLRVRPAGVRGDRVGLRLDLRDEPQAAAPLDLARRRRHARAHPLRPLRRACGRQHRVRASVGRADLLDAAAHTTITSSPHHYCRQPTPLLQVRASVGRADPLDAAAEREVGEDARRQGQRAASLQAVALDRAALPLADARARPRDLEALEGAVLVRLQPVAY